MKPIAVDSTTLAAIGYDESQALLRLEFRSRSVYDYFGVPAAVHEALLRAPSIGAYFNDVIRGCFPYRRVFRLNAGPGPGGTL